ncbi:MAG: hypothetical protein FD162_1449 [Rhodobacteraceae bacterium]|uniref:hypothetical protein n=1 Tax=Cypionkella sp. TaxID=2811411 RepID=UPI0013238CFA|nr:hypothetical protein [Cypionkella sp.]KAF0173943.1 MAG: hypothetical protein FD162_1449 [Paracoccaceae bacterium]MDO8327200.1 hypothetical protein [Cypionkella sp.]
MPQVEEKEVTLEWYRSNVQWTRDLGMTALKTLVTLNSGAFVVLLTFIGNTAAQSAFSVPLISLQTSMYCFLVGICSAFLVMAIAFVNNSMMSPFDSSKGLPDGVAMAIYVGVAGASLGGFVYGVFKIVSSVVLT